MTCRDSHRRSSGRQPGPGAEDRLGNCPTRTSASRSVRLSGIGQWSGSNRVAVPDGARSMPCARHLALGGDDGTGIFPGTWRLSLSAWLGKIRPAGLAESGHCEFTPPESCASCSAVVSASCRDRHRRRTRHRLLAGEWRCSRADLSPSTVLTDGGGTRSGLLRRTKRARHPSPDVSAATGGRSTLYTLSTVGGHRGRRRSQTSPLQYHLATPRSAAPRLIGRSRLTVPAPVLERTASLQRVVAEIAIDKCPVEELRGPVSVRKSHAIYLISERRAADRR